MNIHLFICDRASEGAEVTGRGSIGKWMKGVVLGQEDIELLDEAVDDGEEELSAAVDEINGVMSLSGIAREEVRDILQYGSGRPRDVHYASRSADLISGW